MDLNAILPHLFSTLSLSLSLLISSFTSPHLPLSFNPDRAALRLLQERQHVMDAVFRLLSDSRSRFKALMLDLAKICHNEMTKDGLLAYFL